MVSTDTFVSSVREGRQGRVNADLYKLRFRQADCYTKGTALHPAGPYAPCSKVSMAKSGVTLRSPEKGSLCTRGPCVRERIRNETSHGLTKLRIHFIRDRHDSRQQQAGIDKS